MPRTKAAKKRRKLRLERLRQERINFALTERKSRLDALVGYDGLLKTAMLEHINKGLIEAGEPPIEADEIDVELRRATLPKNKENN